LRRRAIGIGRPLLQRASIPESFIIRSLLGNDLGLLQLAAKYTSHKTVFLAFLSNLKRYFSACLFELSHNELPSTVALLANPVSCGGSAELEALRGPLRSFRERKVE
jgi:hypothetical protein